MSKFHKFKIHETNSENSIAWQTSFPKRSRFGVLRFANIRLFKKTVSISSGCSNFGILKSINKSFPGLTNPEIMEFGDVAFPIIKPEIY